MIGEVALRSEEDGHGPLVFTGQVLLIVHQKVGDSLLAELGYQLGVFDLAFGRQQPVQSLESPQSNLSEETEIVFYIST